MEDIALQFNENPETKGLFGTMTGTHRKGNICRMKQAKMPETMKNIKVKMIRTIPEGKKGTSNRF